MKYISFGMLFGVNIGKTGYFFKNSNNSYYLKAEIANDFEMLGFLRRYR